MMPPTKHPCCQVHNVGDDALSKHPCCQVKPSVPGMISLNSLNATFIKI